MKIDPLKFTPDNNVVMLTEKILSQNEMILKMNASLLNVLASPYYVIRAKDSKDADQET